MKAVLLNGSPRKGNTVTALEALKEGMAKGADPEVREINANQVSVCPCIACDQCGSNSQCVFDDDTNDVISALEEADRIVFATPVYWWGVTAQLKSIIDKLYSRYEKLRGGGKKVGVIVIGEAQQDDPQYQIIAKQFACICDYLEWELVFTQTYTAKDVTDLAKETEAILELREVGQSF